MATNGMVDMGALIREVTEEALGGYDSTSESISANTPSAGYELSVLKPAITPKYIIMALIKTWGDVKFKVQTDMSNNGMVFEPSYGTELRVAFIRKGKESLEEKLPDDVITKEEFEHLLEDVCDLHWTFRKTAIKNNYDSKTSF